MTSVEALDFAIARLSRIRMTSDAWEGAQEALDTLRALRTLIAERQETLA